MVDDLLVDHATPHLAGTVDSEHGLEQCRVITNDLRVNVIWQVHNALDRAAYFLSLYGANNINRRMVTTSSNGLSELYQAKGYSENHCEVGQQV